MQKKLLLLSFIEGAAVMAAELCGAKLLAPVFGSSLYVWASVMGITLAALASGYFFGGYLSSKTTTDRNRLFSILYLAACFVMAMPLIAHYLVPRISYLPFLTGVVISSVCLLFPAVFLLGASSPLFIALQTSKHEEAGKLSGTVYAVSTLGGIFATFFCGFWLIPEYGLTLCLFIFGAVLFVTSLLVSKVFNGLFVLLFICLSYLLKQVVFTEDNRLLLSDGLLGRLEVKQVLNLNGDTLRYMSLNNIIQTEMLLQSARFVSDYQILFDTLVPPAKVSQQALLLGLGGGLAANKLVEKNFRVDAVEIDARVVKAAKDFFFLDKSVNAVVEDARYYLNHCRKNYDVIVIDLYKGEELPVHVLTTESLKRLKQNLSYGAKILINWHGYNQGEEAKGTETLYNTLVNAGFNVAFCARSTNADHRNLVVVASLQPLKRLPYQLPGTLTSAARLNTDDLPVLEKDNALANKKWRANYLRYYQNK